MSAAAGFEPVIEVTADDRARIPFGRVGVHRNERFLAWRNAAGEILLTPMASIPRRELMIWENASVRESLQRGLDDVAHGRVGPLDDLLNDDA
jgi:hypothetical protein